MKKISLIMFVVLGISSLAYAQSDNIAYIDLQRVIRDSKAGKAAKASFQKEFEQKRNIIEQKQKQLEQMRQEFIKNSSVMKPEARRDKASLIDEKEKELQRTREDFREDLQQRDLELTQKILKEIDGILKSIGKSGNYDIIFEKTEAGIVYGSDSVDITDKVIQAYDKK